MGVYTNLQDVFLNRARNSKVTVAIYLVSGYQVRGVIKGFDNYVIAVENEGRQQIVYKHAISTINPFSPISLAPDREDSN